MLTWRSGEKMAKHVTGGRVGFTVGETVVTLSQPDSVDGSFLCDKVLTWHAERLLFSPQHFQFKVLRWKVM